MLFLTPSHTPWGGVRKDSEDPRFADVVHNWTDGEKIDIGIVGIPSDAGAKNSGGRVGAMIAPNAIRGQLLRYGTATNLIHRTDLRGLHITDCGDVRVMNDPSKTHERTSVGAGQLFDSAGALIALGGSHDLSYGTISALSLQRGLLGGANIDAHFDVRPVVDGLITSGTPFRRLLDAGLVSGNNFWEIGAQGHVNAKAHLDYLREKGATVCFLNKFKMLGADHIFRDFLETMEKKCEALFVSFDIDAIAQAFAPGSSAPSPDGLTPEDALHIAFLAGQDPKVRLFEIMEVNPLYDVDERTTRLAANMVLEFCHGFAGRKS